MLGLSEQGACATVESYTHEARPAKGALCGLKVPARSEYAGVESTRLGHEHNTVGLLVFVTNDLEDSFSQECVINRDGQSKKCFLLGTGLSVSLKVMLSPDTAAMSIHSPGSCIKEPFSFLVLGFASLE